MVVDKCRFEIFDSVRNIDGTADCFPLCVGAGVIGVEINRQEEGEIIVESDLCSGRIGCESRLGESQSDRVCTDFHILDPCGDF